MYRVLSDIEKKRLEAPLILGTTYTLNQSETKRVSVGLQPRTDGRIHPIVKLQNNNTAGGIAFDSKDWSLLQTHLPNISKYFADGQKIVWGSGWRTPDPIHISDCEILFTTSYGSKSIVFDRRIENEPVAEEMNESQVDPEPQTKKKRKNYSPAVVMQKPSFEGLQNIMVCADERLQRLQRHAANVQKCIEVLCAELLLHVPANESPEKINEQQIKVLLKNNFKSLKDAVQRRMDAGFVELMFGIVFLEITVLCSAFITNEIQKALVVKSEEPGQ